MSVTGGLAGRVVGAAIALSSELKGPGEQLEVGMGKR
ncbi:hypothetical protein SAMN04489730_3784 [Amycolatopsis australiensis]|uniref:Uncharacterized protein n=1 Tax=Amycolatopsis australiensis TaxID=546364 RepID=A0A1K1RRX8_9PSEU|nr:hypothetical protein SAMN04489730_3784 [Amycolatopsis australiensis]